MASASASSAVGASAVTLIRPVQAGWPVHGSSRWWRGVPSGARHRRVSMPEVATAASSTCSVWKLAPVSGWRTSMSNAPPTRMSPPQSIAKRPSRRLARRSAARPLPVPPVSKRRPGGRRTVSSVSLIRRHGCVRVGLRRGRWAAPARGRARARARGRGGCGRSRWPRAGRRASGRPARRSARRPAGPPRSRRAAGRDLDLRARVGVEAAQLAAGAEAAQRRVEVLEERPARVRLVGQQADRRCPCSRR